MIENCLFLRSHRCSYIPSLLTLPLRGGVRRLRHRPMIHTGSEERISFHWCWMSYYWSFPFSFNYCCLQSVIIFYLYKYFMSSKSKEIHPEQKQMLKICWDDKSNKTVMELISNISSIVRVPYGPKQVQSNIITVYVGGPAVKNKTASIATGRLLMNCLIYCLLKYRNLKIDFYPQITKTKKKRSLVIESNSEATLNISQSFINNITKYLEQQDKPSFGISAFNIKQIDINCKNSGNSLLEINIKRYILPFIQSFYKNIHLLSSNNNFYIVKNNLDLFSNDEKSQIQIDSQDEQNNKIEQNEQKMLRDKIYKQLGVFYIDNFIIKSKSCDIRSILSNENQQKQEKNKNYIEDKEQNKIKLEDLGYFGKFYGNNLQYLSKLHITFTQEFISDAIIDILKALPNLNSIRLNNSGDQIILPNIDYIINVIIQQNKLIEHFWLRNIKVQVITVQILEKLYEQCPYLFELELNLPSQQDQQKKILLNAIRLRKISLSNNIQMSKLLINRKYNFNEIIQIIDCIEPICY